MERVQYNYYQKLYEVAAAVSSARTPQSVLQCIVETAAKAMEAKACAMMLLTPDRKLLIHTVDYGLSDWYIQKGPVSADRSLSEVLKGKAVTVLDAAKDERVQYREQAEKEGIVSILSVPVTLRNEVIGVIRIYSAETRHFTDEDTYFLSAVANLGAIALENARLYESLQRDYNALKHYYFPFL
jgi:GAF domain-containing protein